MKRMVYVLHHSYYYGKNNEHLEAKLLGVFDSREEAEAQIPFYRELPGFCEYEDECFSIDAYTLNERCWAEGFIDPDEKVWRPRR